MRNFCYITYIENQHPDLFLVSPKQLVQKFDYYFFRLTR